MKIVQIILLIIFSIPVLGFSQIQKQEMEKVNWKTLSNNDYAITYPPTWEADESRQMGSSFILYSPKSDKTDDFRDNINLIIQDLTGYNLTLDQYVEISEGQIKTMITDSKVIVSKRVVQEDNEFHKVIYTGKQGQYDLKFEQYYWVINNKAYIMTLTCKADEFDNYQEIGETILGGLMIK